ncbi:SMC-Scp complex subunit ScpB [Anaerobacillus sp. MEB173]|uniref:SMC-Scp complex subunit ScpB n=1 Tax=Anaerobacillus sp. MEB173 TaxID=3383345 RepID=UPI003F92BA00
MKEQEMKAIIEGLLFISGDEGIECKQIAEVLEIDKKKVKKLIQELAADYKEQNRGIQLVEYAESYQYTTKPEHAEYFKRLVDLPSSSTLSQAALETLAIVAYRQPITRVEIEEIRGVKSEKALQTLIGKMLIKEVGRAEGPGRAILYGTTKYFLEQFGLKTTDELPPLKEDFDEQSIEQEADLFFERFQEKIGDLG